MIVSIVTGCGGGTETLDPASTGQATVAPGQTPSSSQSTVAPSAPGLDLVDPAGSIATAEAAMRGEDRERAGLADIGPGAAELAAAMDTSAARVLTRVRADLTAGMLSGQVAGLGPFAPAPGFNSWLVFATLISTLDDFARDPRSGTVEDAPETIEIAGNTGTITSSTTFTSSISGSTLSVDITMKAKGQVVDRATGAVLFGIDSIVTGHIDLDFCPDASGHATASVKLTSSEIYSGGGGSRGASKEFSGDVGITVGDDANITRVEGTQQGSEDAKVAPPGGGDGEPMSSTRTASDNIANDGGGGRLPDVPRAIQFGGEGSTVDQQAGFWGSMSVFVETMVMAAAKEAEKLWKDGKCLELVVDPGSGDVQPNEAKDVTATLRHRIEGTELDKPVVANLTGVKTVDPAGTKQPAPATVRYTAGSEDGDFGEITFESVSNRGIARKTVRFTVRPAGWDVSFNGTDTEIFAIVKNTFKATISDFRITLEDQALAGAGKLRLKGTVRSGTCSGPLDQIAPLTLLRGTVVGTGPDAILRIVISASSPPGGVVHMACKPAGGADIAAEGHAERFGEALLEFDLPAAGGTVRVSRTTAIGGVFKVTVKGTFTVTRGH